MGYWYLFGIEEDHSNPLIKNMHYVFHVFVQHGTTATRKVERWFRSLTRVSALIQAKQRQKLPTFCVIFLFVCFHDQTRTKCSSKALKAYIISYNCNIIWAGVCCNCMRCYYEVVIMNIHEIFFEILPRTFVLAFSGTTCILRMWEKIEQSV